MKTKTINIYTFDELSEKAKEKAREWYREGNFSISQDAFDYVQEDAEQIGLRIVSLRPTGIQGNNEGRLNWDALEVAEEIIKEHGPDCETHKTAKSYLKQLTKENDENLINEREKTEKEFLYDLLEDYRVMFEKEEDYQNSDEVVDENIIANEYEFTEEGERS